METGFCTSEAPSSTSRGLQSTVSFYAGIKGSPIHSSHNGKKKLVCVYCNHSPSVCDIVSDVQKRLETVKRGNLCFTCLGNHKVSLCNFKFLCRNCKHKHTTPACVGLSVKLNKVIRETVTRMVQPRRHRPIHQHKPA